MPLGCPICGSTRSHDHAPVDPQVGLLREALDDAIHALSGGDLAGGLVAVHVARERLDAAPLALAQVPAPVDGTRRLDRLDIDAMAAALEARDVQAGGSPHITPYNRFYREQAGALLALLPPALSAQEEPLDELPFPVEAIYAALHHPDVLATEADTPMGQSVIVHAFRLALREQGYDITPYRARGAVPAGEPK